MTEEINEAISVVTIFDAKAKKVLPAKIKWREKLYTITELSLHYPEMFGKILHHHFCVTDGNMSFHLTLNTQTLTWHLIEVSMY